MKSQTVLVGYAQLQKEIYKHMQGIEIVLAKSPDTTTTLADVVGMFYRNYEFIELLILNKLNEVLYHNLSDIGYKNSEKYRNVLVDISDYIYDSDRYIHNRNTPDITKELSRLYKLPEVVSVINKVVSHIEGSDSGFRFSKIISTDAASKTMVIKIHPDFRIYHWDKKYNRSSSSVIGHSQYESSHS